MCYGKCIEAIEDRNSHVNISTEENVDNDNITDDNDNGMNNDA